MTQQPHPPERQRRREIVKAMFAAIGDGTTGKKALTDCTVEAVDAAIAPYAEAVATLRAALEKAVSALDRAIGDTDPYDPADPLLVACQVSSAALAATAGLAEEG